VFDALQQDLQELGFERPLGSLVKGDPLACLPETPIGQAFESMDRTGLGSVVVVNTFLVPVGILTRYDLIRRVILPKRDLSTPIAEVMTTGVKVAAAHMTVMEAMLLMASHGIRHLPVIESGRLRGVVSESDLMAYQRQSLRSLSASVSKAGDVVSLARIQTDIRRLAARLLSDGLSATAVARLVSHLNDATTRRVIELVSGKHSQSLQQVRWCWLALGSEGREEQTIATDQDNALIFESTGDPGMESKELHESLMAFAVDVNQGLADAGFPLCKGGVMARYPKWCRSQSEWRAVLLDWFKRPTPEKILDAHIFFDFRALAGEAQLAESLRDWLTQEVRAQTVFLRELAQDAMRSRVGELPRPVFFTALARWFRKKRLRGDWLSPAHLDIKRDATAPVVAWTRVLSLARGVSATSTDGRLQGLEAEGTLQRSEAQALREAFDLAQRYRLRGQLAGTDKPNELALDPLSLHEVDRLTHALDVLANLKGAVSLDLRLT
jgi:CBS domain-containing protein